MRRVRMLGLSFAAMMAMAAVAAVAATPALATATPPPCKGTQKEYKLSEYAGNQCETAVEHANFRSFATCPFGAPAYNENYRSMSEDGLCLSGESFYTERWKSKKQREEWEALYEKPAPGFLSHFTAGNVTVDLKGSIELRGGLEELAGGAPCGEEGCPPLQWIAAAGVPSIEPVPQKSIPLTKGVTTSLLSVSELERYNYYVHIAKETKTYATVELAGPAEQLQVNIEHQLGEFGTAFVFPVKVRLTNPFLGTDCYVGSDASPIEVPFTTGQSGELHGKAGQITYENGNTIIAVWGDTLVSTEFSSPGVENCGVDGGADDAVDSALGLPSPTGNSSVLNGVLKLSSSIYDENELQGPVGP